MYPLPQGKAAWATRHVSPGTGGISWGCNDMVRLLHLGYDQVSVMEIHHGSRWPRLLGKHSREFATSPSCAGRTPPRMKMFRRFPPLVQAKKGGLTLVPRVRHQFALGVFWHQRLLPPAGSARRGASLLEGIPLGKQAHGRAPAERDNATHACLLLWFGCPSETDRGVREAV
jgi:hypothetical protein